MRTNLCVHGGPVGGNGALWRSLGFFTGAVFVFEGEAVSAEDQRADYDPGANLERVVVVGNGMVGHRFCEKLAELDREGRFAVTVFGDEPRAAYDRIHLSEFFAGKTAADLAIADPEWYASRSYSLYLGERIKRIDRPTREVLSTRGRRVSYDHLVLATGSAPFVPPIPGVVKDGVFVYRTIEDLEAIRDWAGRASRAAVIGGGLLGLEAAKAVLDMGLEAHVVEFAERLMPRQLDAAGGAFLRKAIEELGVHVQLAARTEEVLGNGVVEGLRRTPTTRTCTACRWNSARASTRHRAAWRWR